MQLVLLLVTSAGRIPVIALRHRVSRHQDDSDARSLFRGSLQLPICQVFGPARLMAATDREGFRIESLDERSASVQ